MWQRVPFVAINKNEMALETMPRFFLVKIKVHYFKHLNATDNPSVST